MLLDIFILSMIASLITGSHGEGHYTIIGSGTIIENSNYAVCVSAHNSEDPCSVQLTIHSDKGYSLSQDAIVPPHSSKTVEFAIGPLAQGDYKLTAVGQCGFKFSNETTINLQSKRQSVFIQTDKAMYKPGDKVQFRVLVLDRNLNPAEINEMNVYITDATQNRIKQWSKVVTTMGVYSQELQLAPNPPLGICRINVEVNGESRTKEFEIAEYVLPKFEVTVSAPKDVTYSDGVLRVTVDAKYTYGESVKGVVEVAVSQPTWGDTPSPTIAQKRTNINGITVVEFQIQSELNLGSDNYQNDFDLKASVTEALTGKVLEGTGKVTIRRNKFTITMLNKDNTYTPGEPFSLDLKIAYYDGSPYVDTVNSIKIGYGSSYDSVNLIYLSSGQMDATGEAKISITLPDSENGLYIFAQFLSFSENIAYFSKVTPSTPSDSISISAKLLTENVKVGDEISIEITSSKPISFISYALSSRGRLILADTESVPNQKSFTKTFPGTFDMVPTAQFVAYYLSSEGDVVSNRIEIAVTGLNNFVTLETSPAERQPGESVEIIISTKPSSQVCLLAVDQSVNILKSGYDILESNVYDDLREYNSFYDHSGPIDDPIDGPIGGPIIRPLPLVDNVAEEDAAVARKKRNIRFPGGGGGGFQDFNNANLFIITNANVPPVFYPWIMFNEVAMVNARDGSSSFPSPLIRKNFPETWIWTCTDSGIDNAQAVSGAAFRAAPVIRTNFPETWIWKCLETGSGSLTIPEISPDTITSWYLTALATNNKYGLGITKDKTVFKVFKKFFVSLNLPYSVKRGESVSISVSVFNYLAQNVTAEVTLDNSLKQFEFANPHTQILKQKGCPPPIELSQAKTIKIGSNDATQVAFLITPLIAGSITIKVTARSSIAADGMQVPLLSVPEGVTQYRNKAQLVDLRQISTFSTDLTVDIPSNVVADSTLVSFSAIGDIMGVTLQNIDSLITIPSGCGEQTMLGLAPDVAILKYLTQAGILKSDDKAKLLKYSEIGYQGEMKYVHPDGSFSAFGTQDASGSSWLAAFVCTVFIDASKFITIDEAIIEKALNWLKSLQQADGCFIEPGRVIHSDMQGEASKGVALSAYIAIAFAKDSTNALKFADVITKALSCVKTKLDPDDIYSLAVACYAFQLANHPFKDDLLAQFDSLAKIKGDLKWWEKVQLETPTDPWCRPPSVNVEISSYGLLAYVLAGRITDALPIMKWLLTQQSKTGGFSSTQDTVVAIEAMALLASKISGGNSMSCSISYEQSQSTININKENALVLQSVELPSTTKAVKVQCNGSGFSLVQLAYQFNLNDAEISPRFNLNVEIDKSSTDFTLLLNICTSFIAAGDGNTSNMAVLEAELPSGFSADLQTIKDALSKTKGVKKVETKKGNTVVVIYLDSVTTDQVCLQVTAYQICKVADAKPVPVQVYDYYNNIRRKTTFYQIASKDVCAICSDDDCKASCGKSTKQPQCPKVRPTDCSSDCHRGISSNVKKTLQDFIEWLQEFISNKC